MSRLLPLLLLIPASVSVRIVLAAEPAAPNPIAAAVARLRNPDATYAAWEPILAIGKAAVPELQKLLSDPSDPVQVRAAVLLYRLGEAGALDKLAALAESRDEEARREAAGALRAFLGAPIDVDPAAPLEPWKGWWKANRDEALKLPPMSALSARVLSVDPDARLVALSLSVQCGAKKGMQLNVARGAESVCLVEIVAPAPAASIARIVPLSERQQPRVGDRAFWIRK